MRRRLSMVLLAGTTAAIACKSAPEPAVRPTPPTTTTATTTSAAPATPEAPPPGWTVGAWPAHLPRETYEAAVATSTDAQAALRHATAALEVRLFGPPEVRPFEALPQALRPLADPTLTARHAEDGGFSVLVATPRAPVIARLDAWAASLQPETPLPERTENGERVLVSGARVEDPRAHLDLLVAHLEHRRAARFVCGAAPVRTSTCAAPSAALLEEALTTFLGAVSMTVEPPNGVPVHPRAGALRPATARITWTSPGAAPKPLADMPVELVLWGERHDVMSTDDGRASAPVPPHVAAAASSKGPAPLSHAGDVGPPLLEQYPDPLGPSKRPTGLALVDAERLLGRLSHLWRTPPIAHIELRPLRPANTRLGLAVLETSAGQRSTDGRDGLRQGLLRTGLGAVFDLPAPTPHLPLDPQQVRALADASAGQLDLLLVGTFDSHFASQMGARSVWYEATADVQLFDAWTGQRITTIEDAARAVAIGDAAAARAAMQTLAGQVATQADRALRAYRPTAMARAP